jgi:hypothetical protein
MIDEKIRVWSVDAIILTGKIEVLGEIPVSLPLYPPQIPH